MGRCVLGTGTICSCFQWMGTDWVGGGAAIFVLWFMIELLGYGKFLSLSGGE